MSHNHQHGPGCGHEHDDDHLKSGEGAQDILYSQISQEGVTILNGTPDSIGSNVLKPWDARMDETKFIESDSDDQLIITIPFTGNVKLREILIKAGPAGHTPEEVRVWCNKENMDFDACSDLQPTQTLSTAVTREVVSHPVKPAKFPSVSSLTLFIPRSISEPTTRIYFLGFKGEFTRVNREGPKNIVYEAAPNLKDHKVKGTESTGSMNL